MSPWTNSSFSTLVAWDQLSIFTTDVTYPIGIDFGFRVSDSGPLMVVDDFRSIPVTDVPLESP